MPRPSWLPTSSEEGTNKDPVYRGDATYYNPVSGKWQSGTFTVHPRCIEFFAEDADKSIPSFHLTLPLCSVSSIKKRTSFFIYAALVIEVGSESHWFSSLENRDSLFNLVELFWREALLSRSTSLSNFPPSNLRNASLLGRQLLSMLHESEDSLSHTATELEIQSRQLNEAQQAICDLNADLTTAEKHLSSYHSQNIENFTDSPTQELIHPALQNAKKILNKKKKHKITFIRNAGNTIANPCPYWEKGYMIVNDENIQLTDEEENLRFQIPADEIRGILVVTPWELNIKQLKDDEESCYAIMCPAMVQLHKILSSNLVFSGILTWKEDIDSAFGRRCIKASGSVSSSSISSGTSSSSSTCSLSPDIPQMIHQVQKIQSSGSLLQEEAKEISTVLENLQTLATEVNKEQHSQMEKIMQLIDDVNKTELRINSDSKVIRKMT